MTIERDFSDLAGKAILIVEDEYFLAKETAEAVRRAGGTVLGPVPNVAGAMTIIENRDVDAAILDIRLGEELSLPVAAALKAKGVAVVFVSGYDDWFLPTELEEVPLYRKPADPDNVVRLLIETKRRDQD